MIKEIVMKSTVVTFTVCFLVLCGCVSYEDAGNSGPSGASGRSSGPEKIGVIFEWNAAASSVKSAIPSSNNPVDSGYPGVSFRARSGNVAIDPDGALNMAAESNQVLMIGCNSVTVTNNGHAPGVFNLSQGTFRLTIDYKDPFGSNWPLRVQINNNTTMATYSVLGDACILGSFGTVSSLQTGGSSRNGVTEQLEPDRIILTFSGAVYSGNPGANSLASAFVALTSTSTGGLKVTGIKLERIE